MKTINIILFTVLPLLVFGQSMPRNADLGKPNPYPFITSALLAIDEAGKDNADKGIELARSKYMPVNDGKIYVEIVHGAVTDLDEPVDGKALEASLNIDVTTTYKNRASAWVEVGRLLDVARRLPPGHSLNEVVILAEDNQGPGLVNSATYATATTGGEGIRIAVIDGGYNRLTAARAAGAAPSLANSTFFNYAGGSFEGGSSSHGTSCLETVFDHAPNAEYYIMKVSSISDLGAAVQDCINNGVDIISHSMSWYNTGWGDNTGPVCAAARDASENSILFFTSAGNRNGTHWQGRFNDPDGDGWHNWSGADEGNNFIINGASGNAGTAQVNLQWNSPSAQDHYDVYLYEAGTNNLLDQGINAGQFKTFTYSTTTTQQVYLAVRARTANPPEFEVFNSDLRCTDFEFASTRSSTTSPSNSTSPNVISIGALPMADYNQPPGTTGIIAGYSSRGPTNNGNPAPDLCAPTNTTTTSGTFTGTSCATPNAAGAAAAFWSGHPQLNARGVRLILYRKAGLYKDWGDSEIDHLYGRGGLYLYNYHADNRYVWRLGGNLESDPELPYYNLSNVEDDAVVAANLRMIHLDPADPVIVAGKVFNKPMLCRSIGGTIIFNGYPGDPPPPGLEGSSTDDDASFAGNWVEPASPDSQVETPGERTLTAFPNPFSSTITLEYQLKQATAVNLGIYDLNGNLLETIVSQAEQEAGAQRVEFSAAYLPPGVYFCRLSTKDGVQVIRLVKGK